jgi:hypothetical protein
MKKEITIKDTIKEMLHQNFKGTKYSKFNEYHLNKEVKNENFVVYTYEVKKGCKLFVEHDLANKEIEFKLWNKFNLMQQVNIQYK